MQDMQKNQSKPESEPDTSRDNRGQTPSKPLTRENPGQGTGKNPAGTTGESSMGRDSESKGGSQHGQPTDRNRPENRDDSNSSDERSKENPDRTRENPDRTKQNPRG
jgi:hypothetical protein